ncbi:MAG: 2Fe-2S iron-sulfur cluster-binding protein [Novosphingobium sp.]|nr:2Fe-2S iron-sulfur cluster-binding protein [Novosphingobium sp.]
MTTQHRINLEQNGSAYACAEDDTLLRAGLRAGLGLAYECNVGACGSCKFDLLDGEVRDLFPEATGLRAKERERGKRLACQCVPVTDCRIKIRSGDEYVSAIRPQRFKARFVGRTTLTRDISLFSFATDMPARFLPGQYAMLSAPQLPQARAYSMSNIPNKEGIWQFIIRHVPGGRATTFLFEHLRENDEMDIDAPFGIAYLRTEVKRPIVGIAGGSGLAPVLSVMRGAAGLAASAGPVLLYGGRTPEDIPDVPQLTRAAEIHVDYHPVISAPEAGAAQSWGGDVGFVHEFIERKLSAPLPDYEYYLAGPPPMIEASVRLLVGDHKVPQDQIHYDRFF